MLYNKFCYPHKCHRSSIYQRSHYSCHYTAPTWPPRLSDSRWLRRWAPRSQMGGKKKKKNTRSFVVMCMTSWELSWISFGEVWTKGEGGCWGLSAWWVDLFVWRSGTVGVTRMTWWSLHKASAVPILIQAVRKHLHVDTLFSDITGFNWSDWEGSDVWRLQLWYCPVCDWWLLLNINGTL